MKQATISLVVLTALILAGCGDTGKHQSKQAQGAPDHIQAAEEALRNYSLALYEEVLPQMADLSQEEMLSIAERIASDELIPHKGVLIAGAEQRLAEFSYFVDLADRSDWENVIEPIEPAPESVEELLSEIFGTRDEHWDGNEDENEDRGEGVLPEEHLLIFGQYDPFRVAAYAEAVYITINRSLEERKSHFFLASVIAPVTGVANRDPESPVIVRLRGPEAVVVALKRVQGQAYLPVRIEWLRRKDAAPTTQEAE